MNHTPRIRDKWANRQLCIGTTATLSDPTVSELIGEAGFDFVWIDMEHSAMTLADAAHHVRAARASGAASWIRVPSEDLTVVKPILELHPAGVIVPRIDSVERAESAVRSCRYPPRGIRGYGPSRGVRYGLISPAEYLADIDNQLMVHLQIEHIDAVNDIENILDVPGFDSVLVGPSDLSLSMNLVGQPDHPDVLAAIETIFKAAIKKNIPAGHSVGFDTSIQKWIDMGLSWIACDGDWNLLMKQCNKMLEDITQMASR